MRRDPYDISRREVLRFGLKWRDLSFPIEVTQTIYYEIITKLKEYSLEQALLLSREEAGRRVRAQVPSGVPARGLTYEEYMEHGRRWVRAVVETRKILPPRFQVVFQGGSLKQPGHGFVNKEGRIGVIYW